MMSLEMFALCTIMLLVFIFPSLSVSAVTNTQSLDLEDGSSQYLSITDASQTSLDITGDITLEA